MQRAFFPFFSALPFTVLGCLVPVNAIAQIVPDDSLGQESSVVVPFDEQGADVIDGGAARGTNLFHSFQEFNVNPDRGAFFSNPEGINNIFSRVTGTNISNINGLLGVLGNANLFLINPNGIIFGENAQLALGGSFFASTADSLLFEGGEEFGASNPQAAPLLEVSIPIGLSFRDNSGDIVNRSFAQNSAGEFVGLEVSSGNTLAFIGGDINFETGMATATGGNIFLGGLGEAGTVSLNADGSLSFPENITLANISLINAADVDVRGTGGGSITVNAQNLSLEAGEFGSSIIRGGIRPESTNSEAQAGDFEINVRENISIDNSIIVSGVATGAAGDGGEVNISTTNLTLTNGGRVSATTGAPGNTGLVNVTAIGDITVDGENSDGFSSGITSGVATGAAGDGGGVSIFTTNLTLTNGGRVNSGTSDQGNSGLIDITATGDIIADGESSDGFTSSIGGQVATGAEGDVGGVSISTTNLTLTNGGEVNSGTRGQGNAGLIDITATGDIIADGENSNGFPSSIGGQVATGAEGDVGGVSISTTNLTLTNGGRVDSSTRGQGNAGLIDITATGDIIADGENSDVSPSSISSQVASDASGDGGGVSISTTNLTLTNGGRVDSSTFGQGNAGLVDVTATGDITADGEDSDGFPSVISSLVALDAAGDGGGVSISTTNLTLTNGGVVDSGTRGQGNAGLVDVTATGDITVDGENLNGFNSSITSGVNSNASGDGGGVSISTTNLTLTNGGSVDSSTFGQGNAGLVDVTATGDITVDGENLNGFNSGITSQVTFEAAGNGGGVNISATNLTLTNGGQVNSNTLGQGNAGLVDVTATGDITVDGENLNGFNSSITSGVNSNASGDGGGVNISATNLTLTNGGQVNSSTFGQGNAGSLSIVARESVFVDGSIDRFRSGISANALNEDGNGGNIFITTGNLSIANDGTIEATNFEDTGLESSPGTGRPGNINITADTLDLTNNARIEAATQFEGEVETGIVNLQIAEDISLENNSFISARAFNNANGGNLTINADNGFILAFTSNGNNDIIARAAQGNGGRISIDTQALFGFEERPATPNNGTNDIDASSEFGLQGDFILSTPDFDPTTGLINLPASVGDASDQISQNPCQQGVGSEFKITGKGGLPPTVNEALNSEETEVGLIEAVPSQQQTGKTNSISSEHSTKEAVPAMGWIFNDKGEVTLTAYSTSETSTRRTEKRVQHSCSSQSKN